jgi:hypothetical protein
MTDKRHAPKGEPLAADDLAWLADLVRTEGEHAAIARTGMSRNALHRCLAGLGVYAGTRALVRIGRMGRAA